jgi:hypothetical protein
LFSDIKEGTKTEDILENKIVLLASIIRMMKTRRMILEEHVI